MYSISSSVNVPTLGMSRVTRDVLFLTINDINDENAVGEVFPHVNESRLDPLPNEYIWSDSKTNENVLLMEFPSNGVVRGWGGGKKNRRPRKYP